MKNKKCVICGTEKVDYYKPDAKREFSVKTRYGEEHRHYETHTAYYCHKCALAWCHDYSGIMKICVECGDEVEKERVIKDCDNRNFCSEKCMLHFHHMNPIMYDPDND